MRGDVKTLRHAHSKVHEQGRSQDIRVVCDIRDMIFVDKVSQDCLECISNTGVLGGDRTIVIQVDLHRLKAIVKEDEGLKSSASGIRCGKCHRRRVGREKSDEAVESVQCQGERRHRTAIDVARVHGQLIRLMKSEAEMVRRVG